MRRLLGLVAIASLVATFAACGGGGDNKTIDVPGGGQVSSSNKVPDAFPDDFPIPDGADVQGSYTGRQGEVEGTVVTWTTDDSASEVKDFYEKELAAGKPWTSQASGDAGGSSFFSAVSKDGKQAAYVAIAEADGKTSLIVSAGDNTSGNTSDETPDDAADETPDDSGGNATLPDEVDLSADFPSDDVPLPSDARVTNSSSFSNAGLTTFVLEFLSKDSGEDIAAYFKSTLEGKGWTQALSTNAGSDRFASYTRDEATDQPDSVNVVISDSAVPGYTQVALTVAISD